ncbi:MAG: flagellar motor protein MotB [Bacteroidota bacterium]|nr:flagellar motor protein MotB [Bacteroidota bacterium]
MKSIYSLLVLVCFASLLNFSCVSKKKYRASQATVERLQVDSTALHGKAAQCAVSVKECNTALAQSKDLVSQLSNKNATVLNDLQTLSKNSQMTIADQAKRLADMQNIILAQRDIMSKLKKTVADALVGFTPEELSIEIRDGNIYVSLQEKLLFKSGSDKVSANGKGALQKLATVLNSNPDINVDIQGHTDSVPIKGTFVDNWALSVARATSIVRILTLENGVNPRSIVASGRGEFIPVATNLTADGRASNRRTEIILSPNLTELFKLLNQ